MESNGSSPGGNAVAKRLTLTAVGDVMLKRDDPRTAFELVQPVFAAADINFGNCESTYSSTGSPNPATRGVVRADPNQVEGLEWAGFHVMSFANNHHLDAGYEAFFETLDHLHSHGIATCGAGKDLGAAREPAIVERDGTKVAFLGYSTILFPGYEARANKAGCTPITIITDYAMSEIEQPGCEAVVTTIVHPSSLQVLRADIARARELADVVVVSVHWGIHFTPVEVAQYESELGRAAIDAGADLVLGHHQHILKAVEVYCGKVIFHGLGNFVVDVYMKALADNPGVKDMQRHFPEYAVAYREDYPTYPFHPEARQTVVARAAIEDKKITEVGLIPCLINPTGQPEPLRPGDPRFDEVSSYLQRITKEAGFTTQFAVGEDVVIVTS
jgi:poly-gamma-glutamate capsule biosynthesis protein CapA/YwtB (metallophosphatase superfamily)